MFALGICYLMGWAMAAADGPAKQRAEWPPHPDRVFMALSAAWFETGQDEAEGQSLHWLEGLKPPQIAASEATHRMVVTSFVPINDNSTPIEKVPGKRTWKRHQNLEGLSIGRNRQPRSFPLAIPRNPVVHLIWPDELPELYRTALMNLCNKVVSIGHSSSLVQMWLTESPPPPNLVPATGFAKYRLRIFGPGRLEYLETRCNRQAVIEWADMYSRVQEAKGKEKKMLQLQLQTTFPNGRPVSLRPEPGLWQGYSEPLPDSPATIPGSLFDPRMIILSLSGKKLSLPSTLKLTQALRDTLLKACPEPIPEWVSGHAPDGSRSSRPHLALLPLPFVGSPHADGRLMGVALAVPQQIDPGETSPILEALLRDHHGMPRQIRLFDGQWLECSVELDFRESLPWNLQPKTWTGPARMWSTVTPVVLDRHFDGKDRWEKAAESLKDSCERIDLPRPVEVLLDPISMFEGVPKANEFPWITRKKDGGRLHHSHAVIVFEQEIRGPVVIGAGRFRGYGLCRPLDQGGQGHA